VDDPRIWLVIALNILVFGYVVVYEAIFLPLLWRRKYYRDWQAYNAQAFHPTREPIENMRGHYRVRRVASEWISKSGKRAIMLHHGGMGFVVHEINADGSFSKKGPYYIRIRPFIWAPTGRTHLVATEVGPGFKTANPRGGTTTERGLRIEESDTREYAPVTLRIYAKDREAQRRKERFREKNATSSIG